MITIGTVKFDFQTNDEPFAWTLNGRWDTFFHTSFEAVAEEVLEAYDLSEQVIRINSLPLDLGTIEKDRFDSQFPLRLREALHTYCRENLTQGKPIQGINVVSTGRNAFDLLSFFLLHGYFPYTASEEDKDLSLLLKKVIRWEAYRFREFLNSYGHYDFLCNRLVYQFTDEELEQVVHLVQPSESKFINLYVRVQIHTYASLKRSDVTRDNYRNVVWTLVLAYVFAEGAGYSGRKQMVLYTIRGLAAHLNMTIPEMIRILTESIRELEQTVEHLPELWNILKEIRKDIKEEIWVLDGDYHTQLLKEVVTTLRRKEDADSEIILSVAHLISILSEQDTCRRLLKQLQEKEIYLLVARIVPQDKEYVIAYARVLDKHKDAGTFSGRAGSEFRLLKWEFIFAVLIAMPASVFNRKQFVLSVLQRLASHYNLSLAELIRLLCADWKLADIVLPTELSTVLLELELLFVPEANTQVAGEQTIEEWWAVWGAPSLIRSLIERYTERQRIALVNRLFPAHSEFIVRYATLLDKGYETGLLEGKAGGEFAVLKWEFIFSCFYGDRQIVFQQKLFVYSVLQRLAAHYNQEVTELIGYFLHHLTGVFSGYIPGSLKNILEELYDEAIMSMKDIGKMRSKSDAELGQWIVNLFGNHPVTYFQGKEEYLVKWLTYLLNERNSCFKALWKAGRLDSAFLLQVVNRSAELRHLWLIKSGDTRLAAIYRKWSVAYTALRIRFAGLGYLKQLGEYITVWMVELTDRKYWSWSETEIIRFLSGRIRQRVPRGFMMLLEKIDWYKDENKNIQEIMNQLNELSELPQEGGNAEPVTVENAGIVLIGPYLSVLFRRAGYLKEGYRDFKDESSRVRAIFLLQYFVYGNEKEYAEPELLLNKILVGKTNDKPLPRSCQLTTEETQLADDLFGNVKRMWDKVSHTSDEGVRASFFQREGLLEKRGDKNTIWYLKVKDRAYDILLDFLPWQIKILKFPWLEGVIETHWRK